MKTLFLAAALVSLATGCAASAPPAPARSASAEVDLRDTLVLRAGSARVHARIDAREIVGPEVMLTREMGAETNELRGYVFGKPALMTVRDSSVNGVVGSQPFRITVSREDGALRGGGLIGGKMSTFHFDEEGARVLLGNCSYDLKLVDGAYAGRRSCGGGRQLIRLYVPDSLDRWSDAEKAAVLTMLINRQQG